MSAPRVSLYCHLARNAPVGVVFRRGPSRQVLLVRWDTRTDTFWHGQWFNGRIYERRCDLAPNGEQLVYFAANYKPPHQTWTAISRPPFLTALALWPKGDAWGGGGLFASQFELQLNHRDGELEPATGLSPPRHLLVGRLGDHPGWGEDDPICSTRLRRDGWRLVQQGSPREHAPGAPRWIDFEPLVVWAKPRPDGTTRWELRSIVEGLHEHGGPWYVTRHELRDTTSGAVIDLGRSDWADWGHDGDLLYALDGSLFRLNPGAASGIRDARRVADLRNLTFSSYEAPTEARTWDQRLPEEQSV